MPDCVPVRIAQAVAAEINTAVADDDITLDFTAAFSFASEITEFQDLNDDTLTVDVVPTSDQRWMHRAGSVYKHFVRVAVGIRRRIAPADRDSGTGAIDTAALTNYVNLIYEIVNLFAAGRELTDEPNAVWDSAQEPTIKLYEPEKLKDGLYFGWIHLPFIFHERAA